MSDSNNAVTSLSDGETQSSPPLTPHSKPESIRAVQSCGHIPRSDVEGLQQTRNECLIRMEILEKRIKRYRQERDLHRKSFQDLSHRKLNDDILNIKPQNSLRIIDAGKSTVSDFCKTPYKISQCGEFVDKELSEIVITTGTKLQVLHKSSSTVKLTWSTPPKSALIIKKPFDEEITKWLIKIGTNLQDEYKLERIYVEKAVYDELRYGKLKCDRFISIEEILPDIENYIDFVVVLGGDGTMCYTSYKFQKYTPPVIGIAMGSLGFLTPTKYFTALKETGTVVSTTTWLTLRTRLCGKLVRYKDSYRNTSEKKGFKIDLTSDNNNNNKREEQRGDDGCPTDSSTYHINGYVSEEFTVLNEFVIQRQSISMVNLQCYVFDQQITQVEADGIIIATPTGSTAYSASAGGSMVHPAVPAMLLTPICPHSLSFRPMILPDSATLMVKIPEKAKNSADVICDGRSWITLHPGDELYIFVSKYPFPTIITGGDNIINGGVTADWFKSIQIDLRWNERKEQKPLPPEYDPASSVPSSSFSIIENDAE